MRCLDVLSTQHRHSRAHTYAVRCEEIVDKQLLGGDQLQQTPTISTVRPSYRRIPSVCGPGARARGTHLRPQEQSAFREWASRRTVPLVPRHSVLGIRVAYARGIRGRQCGALLRCGVPKQTHCLAYAPAKQRVVANEGGSISHGPWRRTRGIRRAVISAWVAANRKVVWRTSILTQLST